MWTYLIGYNSYILGLVTNHISRYMFLYNFRHVKWFQTSDLYSNISSIEESPPTSWDLGFGAKKYKIQSKLDFLLKDLCALPRSPRYPPPLSPILTHWLPVTGANWVPVAGANWEPGAGAQNYKIWLKLLFLSKQSLDSLVRHLCALPGSPRWILTLLINH